MHAEQDPACVSHVIAKHLNDAFSKGQGDETRIVKAVESHLGLPQIYLLWSAAAMPSADHNLVSPLRRWCLA